MQRIHATDTYFCSLCRLAELEIVEQLVSIAGRLHIVSCDQSTGVLECTNYHLCITYNNGYINNTQSIIDVLAKALSSPAEQRT